MTETVGISRGFIRTLVGDVQSALARLGVSDTEAHRREAVRTTFAAIEGVAWVYREHVRTFTQDLGSMTPLLDFALQEKTYAVNDRGDLTEQTRFIPLTAMIRLTTQVAERSCPGLVVDFGHVGWSNLKLAIGVRNRLVHPKTTEDLAITQGDLEIAKSGFFWLLALVIEGMTAVNDTLISFGADSRTVVDQLLSGDEKALADYRAAVDSQDSEASVAGHVRK